MSRTIRTREFEFTTHFWVPSGGGSVNICGNDSNDNYCESWEGVTCELCLKKRSEEPAVEALKSYARLSVLAERERICKLLEATIAEIRKGE